MYKVKIRNYQINHTQKNKEHKSVQWALAYA